MERANNQDCQMVGMLDIKGKDQWRRVYSVDGIAPTLVTCQGGQQEVKIFDTKRLRVRKLTPKEYGILQAFPMDDWKQVVSDSQAYKQFGNAVTTTVFTAIAEEIAKSIYAAEESEEQNMEALMLMDDIIDHNGILPDGVGIPVGNLTSQLFANVYGNKLDKFCKHVLHIPYFVRYMDDFIILSDDLEQLKEWVKRIEEFLENEMLLHINPKSTILYAGNGIDFCGYIHYADHKKVRKSSIRKLKQDVKAYELGELPPEEFNRKYESRKGHLGHADTYHIAKAVEYELLFYEWERLEATA